MATIVYDGEDYLCLREYYRNEELDTKFSWIGKNHYYFQEVFPDYFQSEDGSMSQSIESRDLIRAQLVAEHFMDRWRREAQDEEREAKKLKNRIKREQESSPSIIFSI